MSFISTLDTIILGPLKTLFETIFYLTFTVSENVILSIICLSFSINLLFGFFYRRFNTIQTKHRKLEEKLKPGVLHINQTYSNDDKKFFLKSFYKRNKWSPLFTLTEFLYLILEIPLFIACYQFVSNLAVINNSNFLYINNLASSDSLFKIGSLSFNLLPIIATAINIVSILLYQKDNSTKSKLKACAPSILFFFFLYNAPAGFVFCWLMHNTFMLLTTISYKFTKTRLYINCSLSAIGLILLITSIFNISTLILGSLLLLPIIIHLIKYGLSKRPKPAPIKMKVSEYKKQKKQGHIQFVIACVLLTLFVGVFIPSTYIAASPQEYINAKVFFNPLYYILQSGLLAIGFFMIWVQILYWISNDKSKKRLEKTIFIVSIIMLIDYMFFGLNLGIISPQLKYETGFYISPLEIIVNIIIIAGIILLIMFSYKHLKSFVSIGLSAIVLIFGLISTVNITKSAKAINEYLSIEHEETELSFELSKTGNNVVVIMLDRALGQYAPYIFNELPELKEKFDGFTHYSNTLSFGYYTNICSPALLGGYEYTPVELNKRDTESLESKNNEANLMLPKLFSEAGYNVTVSDPVYVDYTFYSDLSIYDDLKNTKAFYSNGKFVDDKQINYGYEMNMTNFFRFSFMKTLPIALQYILYDEGNYSNIQTNKEIDKYSNQITTGISKSTGMSTAFMNNYLTLTNMNTMTKITSDETNTFLFMRNDLTHEPMLLDEAAGYIPSFSVNNTEYDSEHKDRFTLNGITLNIKNSVDMAHYQTNAITLIELGKWFDHLRANGTYDNTRIILVSDHGRILHTIDELNYKNQNLEGCAPLLMVKDFNSTGFEISNEFMTNADVATLATQNLDFDAINPFTGKEINMDEKFAHPQYISTSLDWNVHSNNGNTFSASKWLSFDSTKANCNIYNLDNWNYLNKNTVLKTHSF